VIEREIERMAEDLIDGGVAECLGVRRGVVV
jgi:hypothetical protein